MSVAGQVPIVVVDNEYQAATASLRVQINEELAGDSAADLAFFLAARRDCREDCRLVRFVRAWRKLDDASRDVYTASAEERAGTVGEIDDLPGVQTVIVHVDRGEHS